MLGVENSSMFAVFSCRGRKCKEKKVLITIRRACNNNMITATVKWQRVTQLWEEAGRQEAEMDLHYIHVDRKASSSESPGRLVFAERTHRRLL